MFLSNILIHSCITILYTVERNICRYCLHAFSTEEILKHHIKECFKINGKPNVIKKVNMLNSKIIKKN